MDGGELIALMPNRLRVEVRASTIEGAAVREIVEFTHADSLDLRLPFWSTVPHQSGEFSIAARGESKFHPCDVSGDRVSILVGSDPETQMRISRLVAPGIGQSGHQADGLAAIVRGCIAQPLPAEVFRPFFDGPLPPRIVMPEPVLSTGNVDGQIVCRGVSKLPLALAIAYAVSRAGADVIYLLNWIGPEWLSHDPVGIMLESFMIHAPDSSSSHTTI